MAKKWWIWAVLIGAVVVFQVLKAAQPPVVLLDVPAMMVAGSISGRSLSGRQEGSFYWSRCDRSGFTSLDLAALAPGGRPEIIAGRFAEPIKGRSRAMRLLGTRDELSVVNRAPGVVDHEGGLFAEFRLFRTDLNKDEYRGFYASTSAGLAAWTADMLE